LQEYEELPEKQRISKCAWPSGPSHSANLYAVIDWLSRVID